MRFAYIGTDGFAADVLERLVDAGRTPKLVVSRPDSRQGRGRQLRPPPVALSAGKLGLNLSQPESADDGELQRALEAAEVDVVCLCAYGAIIREPVLSKWTILNLHPSLLPRWRGAAPIERAILAGDATTGVSIIRLVAELDAGPIAMSDEVEIAADDDFESLSERLRSVGAELLVSSMDRFADGSLTFVAQSDQGVSYADRILADDRLLEPSLPAVQLERTVRALRPHIGARLQLPDGAIVGVREAVAAEGPSVQGEIRADAGALVLGCSDGSLRVTRLVPPGGREMAAADWLRGRPRLDGTHESHPNQRHPRDGE